MDHGSPRPRPKRWTRPCMTICGTRLDVLDAVNLRIMFDGHGPAEGSSEAPLTVLSFSARVSARHRVGERHALRRSWVGGRIAEIVCVQNSSQDLAHRTDDALIDDLGGDGVADVPFFSTRRFQPAAVVGLVRRSGATPMQVALAWLLRRAPNIPSWAPRLLRICRKTSTQSNSTCQTMCSIRWRALRRAPPRNLTPANMLGFSLLPAC